MTEADGKVADGKGLDNVVSAVLAAYVLQNSFIERTPDGELEVRVMSQAHICEVLVRQQFYDGGRDGGQACFTVVAVP